MSSPHQDFAASRLRVIPWISREAMIADLKHYPVMKFSGVLLQVHAPSAKVEIEIVSSLYQVGNGTIESSVSPPSCSGCTKIHLNLVNLCALRELCGSNPVVPRRNYHATNINHKDHKAHKGRTKATALIRAPENIGMEKLSSRLLFPMIIATPSAKVAAAAPAR